MGSGIPPGKSGEGSPRAGTHPAPEPVPGWGLALKPFWDVLWDARSHWSRAQQGTEGREHSWTVSVAPTPLGITFGALLKIPGCGEPPAAHPHNNSINE